MDEIIEIGKLKVHYIEKELLLFEYRLPYGKVAIF